MSNLALLCISLTALTSASLLVTCAKMSTDMTTPTPKPMDSTKMMENPKMLDSSKMEDNTKMMGQKNEEVMANDNSMKIDMDFMDAMSMCNDSFRTEMSFLIALNESGSFPDETDQTPKCFLRCMLQSLEIATVEEGTIDPQRAATYFARERHGEDVLEIAAECARRDEENHCNMAYNFLSCLFSKEIERNNKTPKP